MKYLRLYENFNDRDVQDILNIARDEGLPIHFSSKRGGVDTQISFLISYYHFYI